VGRSDEGSPGELIRALAIFTEPPAVEHASVARSMGLGEAADGREYAQLFSFQLYPYASVYLGPEGMMGGEAADRVAGFWRAVGHEPPSEPDHLSGLLGLYAALLEAEDRLDGAERSLTGRSRAALLHEHLAPWVFSFLQRVEALAGKFHRAWAGLLADVLSRELKRGPAVAGLPVHLREAPGLPDPREAGGAAFVEGLLAPVRTGMILCRADLGRIGRSLDLGVRVGERRYVLEHLLGQDAVRTLAALGQEARVWRDYHGRQEGRLGETAAFWSGRSAATEGLLVALAEAGETALRMTAEATT
jgi:hypothetical protein